jgi:hypothetical protein
MARLRTAFRRSRLAGDGALEDAIASKPAPTGLVFIHRQQGLVSSIASKV